MTEHSTNANFFAILPAPVRYCPAVSPKAKLLYAALYSLARATGKAFAGNKYLGELLDVSEASIKRYVRELEAQKFIKVEYTYVGKTKEIAGRLISILPLPLLLDLPKTPALHAVIFSHVLGAHISAQAKLLYAEISAATPTDGFCTQPTSYFAKLLNAGEATVRRWLKELTDSKLVRSEMEYVEGTKEIRRRRLYLTDITFHPAIPAEITENGSEACTSDEKPKEQNAALSPKNGRNIGMLIFEPTYKGMLKNEPACDKAPKKRRNKRRIKRERKARLRL